MYARELLEELESIHRARPRPQVRWFSGEMERVLQVAQEETLQGNIVLTVHVFRHLLSGDLVPETVCTSLDKLHLSKIDLADEVIILNVGGYMGEGTKRELAYAQQKEKVICYLESSIRPQT